MDLEKQHTYNSQSMSELREALERVQELSKCQKETLLSKLEFELPPHIQLFVREMAVDGRIGRAARACGKSYLAGYKLMRRPEVQEAVNQQFAAHAAKCELKAEYVRDYIMSILELCPTDYFVLAPNGDWCVNPEDFANLPPEVKRLVEGVELKRIGGVTYFSVKFVSKTAALAMASKYTLTQKVEAQLTAVPWDAVAKELDADDPSEEIERRLESVDGA